MRITKRRVLIYLAVLMLTPLITAAILLPTYPLRETDGEVAARLLVAWAVEGQPLPGSEVNMYEAGSLDRAPRLLLNCDWLPKTVKLSDRSSVWQVTEREGRGLLEQEGVWNIEYLVLHRKNASPFFLQVEVTPGIAPRHFYEVTFRRRLWGLEARVRVVRIP